MCCTGFTVAGGSGQGGTGIQPGTHHAGPDTERDGFMYGRMYGWMDKCMSWLLEANGCGEDRRWLWMCPLVSCHPVVNTGLGPGFWILWESSAVNKSVSSLQQCPHNGSRQKNSHMQYFSIHHKSNFFFNNIAEIAPRKFSSSSNNVPMKPWHKMSCNKRLDRPKFVQNHKDSELKGCSHP